MHVFISTINSMLTLLSNKLGGDYITYVTHIRQPGYIFFSQKISMKLIKLFFFFNYFCIFML